LVSDGNGLPQGLEVHPGVLHEEIDGEVIAIDLGTGTYYSLRGSAARVWGLVSEYPGVSGSEIAGVVARYYDREADGFVAPVVQFLDELRTEGLVRTVERPSADAIVSLEEDLAASPVHEQEEFVPPRMEKFTDMQDLVLLDPVHEVGGAGWPHVPPDRAQHASSA
jgi:Coenzyme PQQ synthesis protein D (PqqD)